MGATTDPHNLNQQITYVHVLITEVHHYRKMHWRRPITWSTLVCLATANAVISSSHPSTMQNFPAYYYVVYCFVVLQVFINFAKEQEEAGGGD